MDKQTKDIIKLSIAVVIFAFVIIIFLVNRNKVSKANRQKLTKSAVALVLMLISAGGMLYCKAVGYSVKSREFVPNVVQSVSFISFGIAMLIACPFLWKQGAKKRNSLDEPIKGRVFSKVGAYSNKEMTVEYNDPFSGDARYISVAKPVGKFYRVGGRYDLIWSNDDREAYDPDSDSSKRFLAVICTLFGLMCIGSGIVLFVRMVSGN